MNPQYELMYIISADVPDSDEPKITESLTKLITDLKGEVLKVEALGRKRLAYPIKKTRNGLYVLINFRLPADKVAELDHQIRVTSGIIRYLLLNLEEQIIRLAKDQIEQRQIRRAQETAARKTQREQKPEIQIDLDKQIEKALQEDITK